MNKKEINIEYFNWMLSIIHDDLYSDKVSFRKLLRYLHDVEFTWIINSDINRAVDGIELRRRFSKSMGFEYCYLDKYLEGPCTVLEMILALAIRCEETIMDDPSKGDRTKQWFWGMINNLGLGAMTDNAFDRKRVKEIIDIFLNREYKRNGVGGLFMVRHCNRDLRKVDIWRQLCWYLNTIS